MTILHNVCCSLVPLCINYRTKEQQYQREFNQILESYLPAIMPTFNKSRVDPQPHGRYKRFVSTLTRIMFDGVNDEIDLLFYHEINFCQFIKAFTPSFSPQKGIKKLLTKQMINKGKITALGTQMVSIAQTTLKEIERLQKDTVDNNKRLKRLTLHVMQIIIDKFIQKLNDNANAIRFLAFIL